MTTVDRPPAVEDAIESMERSAEVYGLSRSAGRVYGVLYFAPEPLSIPDLVDETGYAKSTISTVTRRLTRIGLVRRRSSGGGGRRVRFAPETDVWAVVRRAVRQHLLREMAASRRTLADAADRLAAADDAHEAELERVRDLVATYEELQRLVELAMERSPAELIAAIEAADER